MSGREARWEKDCVNVGCREGGIVRFMVVLGRIKTV